MGLKEKGRGRKLDSSGSELGQAVGSCELTFWVSKMWEKEIT
jgi:hypothetical protein